MDKSGGKFAIAVRPLLMLAAFFVLLFAGAGSAQARTNIYAPTIDITTPTTWTMAGSPYVISGWAWLDVTSTLTIDPGVIIKFTPDHFNQRYNGINVSGGGKIMANGTADAPVIFTSYYDDTVSGDTNGDGAATSPVAGDWRGIILDADASALSHVEVRYGANIYQSYGGIEIKNNSTASLADVSIKYSAGSSLRLNQPANPTITNITLDTSNDFGIYSNIAGSSINIVNATITNATDGVATLAVGNTLTFTNAVVANTRPAIYLTGATVSANAAWPKIGSAAYVLDNDIAVATGATLTIAPGVVVKGEYSAYPDSRLEISGRLLAQGTAEAPIIFTSLRDDTAGGDSNNDGSTSSPAPGDWGGLYFENSANSALEYVAIRYGGNYADDFNGVFYATTDNVMLHLKNSSLSIATSTISLANTAIYLETTSTLTLSGSTIATTTVAILSSSSLGSTISGSSFINNTHFAISNTGAQIDARHNWWSDDSGPAIASNPAGTGNSISSNVLYSPWTVRTPPNQAPTLSYVSVSGYTTDGVEPNVSFKTQSAPVFKVAYSDPEDVAPSYINLVIASSTSATYALATGTGGVYEYSAATNTFAKASYTYHFEASDGVNTARLPASGELSFAVKYDPVIIIPGIMGSWNVSGVWELDPIFNTYDNLWQALQNAGYQVNVDLFALPYNWRLANTYTAGLLKDKITQVKQACGCNKVDIIAHSMGGLVVRAYVELLDYGNDIDQLIFLATPHRGSTDVYLAWEGGELGLGPSNLITQRIFKLEAELNGYGGIFEYIRGLPMSSIQELLPIYPYLHNSSQANLKDYPNDYPRNIFLEQLNVGALINKLSGIKILNILADAGNDSTINSFRTVNQTSTFGEWEHGYPENYDDLFGDKGLEYGEGDSTVPKKSNENFIGTQVIINSTHRGIVTDAQKNIIKELTGIEPNNEVRQNIFSRWLLVRIFSPADFKITDPNGQVLGKDFTTNTAVNTIPGAFYSGFDTGMEFAVIPDPLDGQYGVELEGTGTGSYKLAMDYIDDNQVVANETVGNIAPEQYTAYTANYVQTQAENFTLAPNDSVAPVTTIKFEGSDMGNSTYRDKATISFVAADNDSGVQKIEYNINGAAWQTYQNSFILDTDGGFTIQYRSIDNVGNVETAKTAVVRIQKATGSVIPLYVLQPPPTTQTDAENKAQPEPRVLGEETKLKIYTDSDILSALSNGSLETLLDYLGLKRDLVQEQNVGRVYLSGLLGSFKATAEAKTGMLNFIAYGTKSTEKLGIGERAAVLHSYKTAFNKLPQTADDWQDVLRIASGELPDERNQRAETGAQNILTALQSVGPNNTNTSQSIMIIAYGLRPADRDILKEAANLRQYTRIFKKLPATPVEWNTLRLITYFNK